MSSKKPHYKRIDGFRCPHGHAEKGLVMIHRKALLSCAAALLAFIILLPSVQSADPLEGVKAKIAPALGMQLSAAKPDEYVTAIVKMNTVANLKGLRGNRKGVFTELRAVSHQTQDGLARYLESAAVKPKVKLTRRFWIDNLMLVQATPDVIREIAARSDVREVFDNFTVTMPPRPDDGHPTVQQGAPLWDPFQKIGVKQVWSTYGINGTGVVVGGLDTGVDITHPDISGKMVTLNPADPTYPGGWAEFDANGNVIPGSVPHDSDQHGTHTTGTVLGGSASGYPIGVAPGAHFIHGLVIPGGSGTFAQVAGGMEWIIDPDNNPATNDGAQVVNMSLGGTGTYSEMVAPTDNMVAANVFPSFSIGNSGPGASTTGSPGNVPSAFGVGATDSLDVIASFSSRGPVTWNYPPYVGTWIKPDISAPGVLIFSSIPGGTWEGDWSGTSMAAPHITGTVALMLQANPTLTVDQVKLLLQQTAVDRGDPGMDNTYGWGRVNAFAAVSAALTGIGTLEGTISSSGGGAVEGAKVRLTDTGQQVYSDASGHYTLKAVAGDHSVQVSRFGYDTYTTAVTIAADVTTTLDVTLNQLPSGVIAGYVTDSATGTGIETSITIKYLGDPVLTTSTNPATGAYSIALPVGTYDLVFNPTFPYPMTTRNGIAVAEGATTTLDVALNAAQVLIVDDDGGANFQTYFETAVTGAGRSYLTVTAPPTAATMALFESVVWLTGNDYTTTLTTADIAELSAYLDAGGRLFITGQDIGYDIGTTAFYTDYLHAAYVQDDVGLGGVLGVAASAVGNGFAFEIQGGSGANNQAYPSEIDPVAPAAAAFVYDPSVPSASATANDVVKNGLSPEAITSSGTAGLTFENGTYKLVYFAFGFEAVADATTRTALMERILDWLQGYPKIAHTPLGDTEDTEHPYVVRAVITSEYFALDPSTCAVVYDAGAGDVTVAMTPTGVPDQYEASIPAQEVGTEVAYYITASDVMGHTTTDPMGAPGLRHIFHVAWDTEKPVAVHVPHRDTNDLVGPYGIDVVATDNIGVESVYLMYAKNGGFVHRQRMELMGDGHYHGAIPGPAEVGDYFEYWIYAMDEAYSANVRRMPATGSFRFDIVEYFMWDFEPDNGGFVQTGDVWEWGAPTTGPGSAHSGVNVWATMLATTYPTSANAKLDIPPISIAASMPYTMLTFWHWYETENTYDGGNVKVSADGGATWDVVTPIGGYDGTASTANAGIPGEPCFMGTSNMFWQQEMFDLSAYAGQTIMIRFHFGSDGSVNKSGWYVDDVMVRSTDTDDYPPSITATTVPGSTFDTAGPYTITTKVMDILSTVASVSLFYTTDNGLSFTEVAMTPGSGDLYSGDIPGQPSGTKIKFYIKAVDSSSSANETVDPAGAPASLYSFGIMPSSPTLVVVSGSTSGTSLDMFRAAFDANGHEADFWNRTTQGWLTTDKLMLYKYIFVDEPSGLTTDQMNGLTAYLASGTQDTKKRLVLMGRDLGYSSSTRPWLEQYMRANYVQDNPNYWQITGYPGDPIGAGESFIISGSYPDEWQRSTTYPGGEIVYQYTGTGTSRSRSELQGEYEKEGKEWDGVVPNTPISLDAAAAIKYNAENYRSVAFAFNLYYVQEAERRAAIMDRTLAWLSAPDIVHAPLHDTEDTDNPYPVVALVYSETLDAARVNLVYDLGSGPVQVVMTGTGTPHEYRALIPAQPNGTTVQYYISAANLDGTTSYHPSGAPADKHIFRVTTDITPPEIVHVPLGNTADLVGPYVVEATITDNIAVDPATVSLTFNKNGGANVTVPMTAMGGDVYRASIPGPSVVGDVYNYFIIARDVAAVPNTGRSPATGYYSFSVVDYYAWDFEGSNGGFATAGPDWEWGVPTYASGPSAAHSGVKLWGTKLAGTYSGSSNSKLDLPAIGVPGSHTYAFLTFWQWYNIESNYDGANVKISTDGGATWTILTPDVAYNGTASSANAGIPGEACWTGTTTGNFWHKVTINLTAYKGQSVIIRFHFGSDSSVNYAGWYIDDVRVEGGEDTGAPTFVSTTVPTSTWDTVGPYVVTTKVTDGLSGVASVSLHYSVDNGATWNTVAMAPTTLPEYGGDIPGQPSHTRILVYVSATDNAGNSGVDPSGAPSSAYQFSVMPAGDYLVILGGGSNTPAQTYVDAFTAIGKTCDVWNWDTQGMPTVAMLNSYIGVIVDESWYFDTNQIALLTNFLNQDDGTKQQIVFWGRDLSYGSGAPRTFMEQYTGMAYVQDDPGSTYRWLWGTPGDPIGNGEKFSITGSYPDELKLSTAYPGAQIVFKYHLSSSTALEITSEEELLAFYYKAGKVYDGVWPMTPTAPDSAAAGRYVGTYHASVYFAFQFNYITDATVRANVLDRSLNWLVTATEVVGKDAAAGKETPAVPDRFNLSQNYPNPFNPVTAIEVGVPAGFKGNAELRIFNVKGELVATLHEGAIKPGTHTFLWDGTNQYGRKVTSGIYFCRFICGTERMTKKMVLLR
jgi:subtilisin family serine protease